MKFFWRKRNSSSKKRNDEIISQILEKVEERRELLNKIKSSYNPKNDERESRVWYFINSTFGLSSKLSIEYLEAYQERYKVKLPELIIRILIEIGSGRLLNHSFLDAKGELQTPLYCFDFDFLQSCLDNGVNPKLLEDEMFDLYDIENDYFNNPEIQTIYNRSKSNRDKSLIILFPLGGHSSYLILNRENNEELAVFNISGICNKTITIDDYEYDFPFYQYTGGSIGDSILQNINTDYWKMILQEINEMNKDCD